MSFNTKAFFVLFGSCIVIPLVFAIIFFTQMMKQAYDIKSVTKKLFASLDELALSAIIELLRIPIDRINGWLKLMVIWNATYHVLNAYGILFGVLNFFNIIANDGKIDVLVPMVAICSLLSSMSTFTNMSLNPNRMIVMFRNAWCKGERATNEVGRQLFAIAKTSTSNPGGPVSEDTFKSIIGAIETYHNKISDIESGMEGI